MSDESAVDAAAKLAKKKTDLSGVGIPVTLATAHAVGAALAPLADHRRIKEAFAKPFAADEIKMKPAMVKGNRALVLHYIDARLVMDRLDEVVEPWGWRDEYTLLPGGEVECRLSVKFGDAWVTKADVGGQSEQPDDGDKMKAAYSDALKRAAVKFGIGRHLYRMPQQWMDYDPVRKQIVKPGERRAEPQQAPPPRPTPYRVTVDKALDAVADRERLGQLYVQFDADVKAGKVSEDDKRHFDARFRELSAKFPKPAPAKA